MKKGLVGVAIITLAMFSACNKSSDKETEVSSKVESQNAIQEETNEEKDSKSESVLNAELSEEQKSENEKLIEEMNIRIDEVVAAYTSPSPEDLEKAYNRLLEVAQEIRALDDQYIEKNGYSYIDRDERILSICEDNFLGAEHAGGRPGLTRANELVDILGVNYKEENFAYLLGEYEGAYKKGQVIPFRTSWVYFDEKYKDEVSYDRSVGYDADKSIKISDLIESGEIIIITEYNRCYEQLGKVQ